MLDFEKRFMSSVINKLSSGGHPCADETNLEYFTSEFKIEMLDMAINSKKLTEKGTVLAKKMKEDIENENLS